MNFEFTEVMNDRQITLKYSIFDMMTQTFFVRLIWFDWDELEFKTFFFVLDYSTSIDHYFDSIHVIFNHHFYVFVFFDFQKKTIQRGVTICFDYPLEMERAFIAFFYIILQCMYQWSNYYYPLLWSEYYWCLNHYFPLFLHLHTIIAIFGLSNWRFLESVKKKENSFHRYS